MSLVNIVSQKGISKICKFLTWAEWGFDILGSSIFREKELMTQRQFFNYKENYTKMYKHFD